MVLLWYVSFLRHERNETWTDRAYNSLSWFVRMYYVKLDLKCVLLWLPGGWKIKVSCFDHDHNRWSIGWVSPIISYVGDNFVSPSGYKHQRNTKPFHSNSVLLTLWRYNIGDFEQVATETSSLAVVDAESWGEYVTVTRQIATLGPPEPSDHAPLQRTFFRC